MKILVENSGYHLLNMGDVAMLQIALKRLSNLYPNATIQVLTTNPSRLQKLFPDVYPIAITGRNIWFFPLLGKLHRLIPRDRTELIGGKLEDWLRYYAPSAVLMLLALKLRKNPMLLQEVKSFLNVLYDADLVIATGGGYITDAFKQDTLPRLATLRLSARLGKPTVLVGQGLGPIRDSVLLQKAQDTLSLADLIAIREKRAGLPLLQEFNVSQDKVMFTGDDAIELAYSARRDEFGDGIGINLRAAIYSGVGETYIQSIRLVLHKLSEQLNAPFIPVPIDHAVYEGLVDPDSTTIQNLLKEYVENSDGGASLDTPLQIIQQVSQCRLVITGSYHAGVFALSQGIPVIGLAKSQYYIDKFFGLLEQFRLGCTVLLLDDPELELKLYESVNYYWNEAEKLRSSLLIAARQQIQEGESAYKSIYEITTKLQS